MESRVSRTWVELCEGGGIELSEGKKRGLLFPDHWWCIVAERAPVGPKQIENERNENTSGNIGLKMELEGGKFGPKMRNLSKTILRRP